MRDEGRLRQSTGRVHAAGWTLLSQGVWLARVALLAIGLLASAETLAADTTAVTAVDSVAVTVSDMDRAVDFYKRVLTFDKVADREVAGEQYEHLFGVFGLRVRAVRLRLGEEQLELLQFLAPRGRPIPVDSRSNDRWFQHIAIIVSDMNAAYARLRSFNVEHASSGPQRLPDWNPNAAGIEAFYFRDPDEHNLEVLAFPPGKGAAKWHARDGRLFLGIDHTAIVVSNTDASLHFYRDVLGLRVAGTSDNYGTEQEHLNNVFGAHLRITSLRAAQGPGVEFLEYLTPRSGRPIPADTRANDLWYWQINLRVAEPTLLGKRLRAEHVDLVSSEPTELRDGLLGWQAGLVARDPDGHASFLAGQQAVAKERRQ
jgi:catechol 2,3-dioxygenase-like lactoylglutathione lyase family enzyme